MSLSENAIQIVFACGAVLAAAIIMVVLAMWAKRRALASFKSDPRSQDGLDVEKLRDMHRSGLISDEEFSALRRAALGLKPPPAGKDHPAAKASPGLTDGPPRVDEGKTEEPADGQSPRPGEENPSAGHEGA
jgi:FtsZ-interacting cell division protein ZipA